jgi:hypothetical protein
MGEKGEGRREKGESICDHRNRIEKQNCVSVSSSFSLN